MPTFEYTALTTAGERVGGVLAGVSEQAVLGELESRQLVPVSIAEQKERRPVVRRTLPARQMALCYQQIGDLLKAGVPLMRALRLLGNRRSRPQVAATFRELADAVAEGTELAEAMSRRPDVFPRIHVAMVRAGEKGGFLEAVFTRLGEFVGAQADMRSKVVGNLIYPAVLVCFGVAILGAMFGIFLPMFRQLFEPMRDRLPWITKVLFAASDLVRGYALVTIALVVVAVVVVRRISHRPAVARRLAVARTWSPVLGPLVRSLAAARFCRMFGTMMANGIPVLTAMQIAKDAAGNVLMEEAIDGATESVRQGQPLARPLGDSGLFPDDVIEMISVGESANNLDEVLLTIADTTERRVDRLLSNAVRLVEPLLLMAIAGIVVVVALALILPMMDMRADM